LLIGLQRLLDWDTLGMCLESIAAAMSVHLSVKRGVKSCEVVGMTFHLREVGEMLLLLGKRLLLLLCHRIEESVALLLLLRLVRVMRALRIKHLYLLNVGVLAIHVLVGWHTVHVLGLPLLVS